MLSPWRCPLPLEEYTISRVVVYFYSGRWVPIMFYSLEEAIALCRRAMQEGREIFVFPSEVNPCGWQHSFNSTGWDHNPQTQITSLSGRIKLETTVEPMLSR